MSNYSILPALSSSSILWTVHCFRWFTSGIQTYPMSLPLLLVFVILASLSFCRAYTALNSLSLQCNKTSYSTKDSCLSIFYHHCKQEGTTSMMYSSIHTEPIWHSLMNKTLRYLRSSAWGFDSSQTRSGHSTFRCENDVLDLEVLILNPAASITVGMTVGLRRWGDPLPDSILSCGQQHPTTTV